MMLPKCRPQSLIAVLSLACVLMIIYAFFSKLVYVSQTCINCSSRYQTSAYEIWPPYVSTYNYRQGWFQNRCIKAGSELSVANLGLILHDWHLSDDLDCRDLYKKFNTIYNVSVRYASLTLPKPFQDKVRMWLGNNAELFNDVYNQVVIHIVNQFTREHTIFNPLRDKRPVVPQDQQESKYFENILKETASTCDFCKFKENTAEHSFHRLESEHSFSASNVFKLDPLHAIFALKQHDPIHWSQEEFMDLAHLTVKWFKKAHEYFPEACYPSLIWDVLPKCGASQVHPHMQGFLSNDRYHGVVEAWRQGAQDYYRQTGSNFYTDMAAVASGLGLAISLKSAIAFASIVPRKDHEIVIMAPTADEDFFTLLYYVIKAFVDDFGKFCFSMGLAYPALDRLEAKIPAYARIITRGVVTEIRSDISSFELFTATNVNIDPYKVINQVRRYILKQGLH